MLRAPLSLALSISVFPALAGYAAAAPPEVVVSRPLQREMADDQDFTGRTAASTTVNVCARLTGYLEKVLFKEGAEVKQGDVLFQLDARAYQAELEKAQAEAARADAGLKLAEADLARAKKLRETGALSLEELNKLAAALEESRASLRATRAALDLVRLNLEYTRITTPISGKIGRSLVDAGNLVNQETQLSQIVVVDPLHVEFDVSERDLLRVRRLSADATAKKQTLSVQLRAGSEEGFTRKAEIDFVDHHLDPATGTLRVRAVMPDPKGELLPGMFVSVRLRLDSPRRVLLIDSGAVTRQDGKDRVLIVNDKGVSEAKPVKVGPLVGGLRVIEEGLGPDDQVVVGGQSGVKPGDAVKPRQQKAPPTGSVKEIPPRGAAQAAPLPDFPGGGPGIVVAAAYPGANARTVEETVAAPIERQLDGLEGVLHRFLVCTNDGELRLTLTFKPGTDLDKALVLVMNRVQIAEPALPEVVRRRGVTLKKRPVFLLAVAVVSPDVSRDRESLGEAGQKLRAALARVAAVAEVTAYGDQAPTPQLYLDFDRARVAAFGLTMAELQSKVQEVLERAGDDPQKLEELVISAVGGRAIRVRDVARVSQVKGFNTVTGLDGKPCATLLVYQSAGANARDTAKAVRARLQDLAKTLPQGIECRVIE